MKFVRFGPIGQERPGALDADGQVRDLSGLVADINAETLAVLKGKLLTPGDLRALPLAPAGARLGCPVAGIGKIVGVGLNYRDHAKECGAPIPQTPILFLKPTTALSGPNDAIVLPPGSEATDWEVELGVVIGTTARNVAPAQALAHVAGYCVAHDVSERFDQLQLGSQWTKGKSHDTFCPVGPWLVTPDDIEDAQNLTMWCAVNGRRVQDSSTREMIFDVAHCIADISRYMTLQPGDLVITGTPAGVGLGQKPATYLRHGDVVTLGIQGLGAQTQQVRRGDAA